MPADSATEVFVDKNSTEGGKSSSRIVKKCVLVGPVFAFVTVESTILIISVSSYSSILSLLIFKGKVMRDFQQAHL